MKIFYGWKMVGAAFGLQFLQASMLNQAFGAYVAVLTGEMGWSKTALSGGAAMQSVEAAVLGPLLGWTVDRFGAQGMIRAGIVVFGIGFVTLSQIDTLTGFCVAIFTIAIGSSLCGYFPLTVAVVQWFEKKRARALSTVSLGMALGGMFVPAVAWSMQTWGWRATAFGSGLAIVLLGWPLARMFRRRPEDMGETVDGEPPQLVPYAGSAADADRAQAGAGVAAAPAAARPASPAPAMAMAAADSVAPLTPVPAPVSAGDSGSAQQYVSPLPAAGAPLAFTAREAMRTSAFWLLSIGHAFAMLVVSAVNVHAITHMSSGLGYSIAQASLVITLMTFGLTGGVILGWTIGDRVEKRRVAAACMLMHATGLLLLTFAFDTMMLVAFALIHGFGWGLRGPFMQAIRADYFGTRSIGVILGVSAALTAVGQVLGPLVAGVLADLTGDYRVGFTLLAVLAAAGSVAFLKAKRPV